MLAPTGKARVRMEQAAKEYDLKVKGQTIAQYLGKERYDGATGRYKTSESAGEFVAETVIVDEASMLTEEMLGALIDSLKGHKRLILIGDPHQLPPIGSGRPFADIVRQFAPENVDSIFPKIGKGYAELTIPRRQGSTSRDDLRLAKWFSGRPVDPGADDIFTTVAKGGGTGHVELVRWDSPDELGDKLLEVIVNELSLKDAKDTASFEMANGGTAVGDYIYFNRGNAKKVEDWQILSPVRGMPYGVGSLNRLIHKKFRQATIDFAKRTRYRKIPRPLGPDEVVYGDKVICVRNHRRYKVYPKDEGAQQYVANGEVGLVVGMFSNKKAPSITNVEFFFAARIQLFILSR